MSESDSDGVHRWGSARVVHRWVRATAIVHAQAHKLTHVGTHVVVVVVVQHNNRVV